MKLNEQNKLQFLKEFLDKFLKMWDMAQKNRLHILVAICITMRMQGFWIEIKIRIEKFVKDILLTIDIQEYNLKVFGEGMRSSECSLVLVFLVFLCQLKAQYWKFIHAMIGNRLLQIIMIRVKFVQLWKFRTNLRENGQTLSFWFLIPWARFA